MWPVFTFTVFLSAQLQNWLGSNWIESGFLNKFIWVVMISGKDDELAKCQLNVTGKGRVSVVWVESGVKWLLNCLFDHPSLVSVRFVIMPNYTNYESQMFVKWFSHFVWSLFLVVRFSTFFLKGAKNTFADAWCQCTAWSRPSAFYGF